MMDLSEDDNGVDFDAVMWDDLFVADPVADEIRPKLRDYGCRRKTLFVQKWQNPGSTCLTKSRYVLIGNVLRLRAHVRREYGDLVAKRMRHISDDAWKRYLRIADDDVKSKVLDMVIKSLETLEHPTMGSPFPPRGITKYDMQDLITIASGGTPRKRIRRNIVLYPEDVSILIRTFQEAIGRAGVSPDALNKVLAKILGPHTRAIDVPTARPAPVPDAVEPSSAKWSPKDLVLLSLPTKEEADEILAQDQPDPDTERGTFEWIKKEHGMNPQTVKSILNDLIDVGSVDCARKQFRRKSGSTSRIGIYYRVYE